MADAIRTELVSRWAPIPLRLIVGIGFMAHGFTKLARGPDAFADILRALGVPAPHLMAWATILSLGRREAASENGLYVIYDPPSPPVGHF